MSGDADFPDILEAEPGDLLATVRLRVVERNDGFWAVVYKADSEHAGLWRPSRAIKPIGPYKTREDAVAAAGKAQELRAFW